MENLFQNNDGDHYMNTVNQSITITEILPICVRTAIGYRANFVVSDSWG